MKTVRHAIALDWHNITPSNSPKFFVRGTQLNYALYANSRFKIVEIRTYDRDGYADRSYAVYDAHTVSDAQVAAGVAPKRVGNFATLDETEQFLRNCTNA